jgi:hypothetical protein
MTTEKDIRNTCLAQAADLEAEFFETIEKGQPSQRRVLKPGKTLAEFNTLHDKLWGGCEQELVAGGFVKPPAITDYKALYAAAASNAEKVDVLAKFLEIKE